ncbi:hypothetical protein IC229_13575 [Spirosoma sp. BT702]|uniref:Uncharacterized protein n=1 Tax=Spirosoma profusum TaxID=2771354 RepID=A0A926Y3A3_9BACT|nr:hypothetical protein [Spirosoma profusum]
MALCSCKEQAITPQPATMPTSEASARQGIEGNKSGGQTLPQPTIIQQVYVPANDLFAHTRCRAWRITWPTYPAGTSPNQIPTMFSVSTGTPYSFNYLNNTSATTTYKTDFNLYHNNTLASVYDMWSQLTHVVGNTSMLEQTWFNKSEYTAAQMETWVKGRPSNFETFWEHTVATTTEIENYKQGDLFQFRLVKQNRYGGIRIVSMTPRIIEVYLAEPNI